MNALYSIRLFLASLLACMLLVVAATTPVEAQTKKKKATTTQQPKVRQQPPQQQQPAQQSEEEPAEEEQQAVEEEDSGPAPSPQAKTIAQPANFKDLLKQFVGQKTNLGVLKKITNDYIVFEDESTTAMYRSDVIHSVQVIREEGAEPRVEIGVLSKE